MENFWQKNILENHFVIGLGLILAGFILWELKTIIISLFIAYILMAAMAPLVDFLVSKRLRRGLAVAIVFTSLILVLFAIIVPIVPFVSDQTGALIDRFPLYLEKIGGADLASSSSSAWMRFRSTCSLSGSTISLEYLFQ